MIEQTYRIAGDEVRIHVLERDEDLGPMREWFAAHGRGPISFDTEGTGLNLWAAGYQTRLVQLGDGSDAWVIPTDRFAPVVRSILGHKAYRWRTHNGAYDVLATRATKLMPVKAEEFATRMRDSMLLSHLIDPRQRQDGGTGHGLKPLGEAWVDPSAPDTSDGLKEVFKRIQVPSGRYYKTRKKGHHEPGDPIMRGASAEEGWSLVDLFDPTYTLYAGLDVILTHRLHDALEAEIVRQGYEELARYEHAVLRVCLKAQATGMRLDVRYAEELSLELLRRHEEAVQACQALGLDNPSATKQVADALQSRGVVLTETTATGAPKVDRHVLADLSKGGDALVVQINEAKRTAKWRTSYVEAMLTKRDWNDRVHPNIRTLGAQTGRMSVNDPPFQQLPGKRDGGGGVIRRCIIPDEGQALFACDYDQLELRIIAALSGCKEMIAAIKRGENLHKTTARLVFGDGYTPVQYLKAKQINLGKQYGSGVRTLAKQMDEPEDVIRPAIERFDEVYPEIRAFFRTTVDEVLATCFTSEEVQKINRMGWDERKEYLNAERRWGHVVTPIGKRIPVESWLAFKGVNYKGQNHGREVIAQAGLRIDNASLSDHILLFIHDEIIGQAPVDQVETVSQRFRDLMCTEFMGVPLTADLEIKGEHWGVGYE